MTDRYAVCCLAGLLLVLLCAHPALGSPNAVSYEQYVTLIHDQDDHGGCIGQSMNHVVEIYKEMEAPYTPDPSYGFHWYVYAAATAPGGDPRVADRANENTYHMMAAYGAPPETSYPTNFDLIGNDNPATLNHPPSDEAFSAGQAYRMMEATTVTNNPTIAQAEDLIASGPIVCEQLFPSHAVALIGYNKTAQEFTIVDSANWMGIGHAGIKKVPYSDFQARQSSIFVTAVTNRATPLVDPYTARIRISHDDRRSLLTVRIGAVGHDPVTVWDQNNLNNWTDWGQDLAIDVPLPAYAAEHWPPSDQNQWYVQVINHDTDHNAVLREVTLVRRQANGALPVTCEVHPEMGAPRTIPPGTTQLTFPRVLTVTSPNGGEVWTGGERRTVTFTQEGFSGTNVRIDLLRGTTTVATIAPSWPAIAGSKDWYVPTSLAAGSDYYVQVQSLADPVIKDRSNAPLTVRVPAAAFTALPVSGLSPLTVQFTDTSIGDPVGWNWSFGDGQTSTTRSPSHSYANAGTYSVTLTVTYQDGSQRQITKQNLVAVYQSLSAGFTVGSRIGYAPYSAAFTDTTTGNPTSWNWSFGDGSTSTAKNPVHTYQNAGTYTVRLVVANPYDTKTATKTDYIRVLALWNGLIRTEAEDYDYDNPTEGVGYHDTTAGNSGGYYRSNDVDITLIGRSYVVTDTAEGEWTRYWVQSPSATEHVFPLGLRVAGWAAGQRVTVSDAATGDSVDVPVPYTGSPSLFATVNASLRLGPGMNVIRLTYHGSAMNVDYFTLEPSLIRPLTLVPGAAGLPTSTAGNGLYDDVNGNGRDDFADVVLYFNQMTWISANEPVTAFDYNGNGRIDFADVAWLFNNL